MNQIISTLQPESRMKPNKNMPWVLEPSASPISETITRRRNPRGRTVGLSYFKRGMESFLSRDYPSSVQSLTKAIKSLYLSLEKAADEGKAEKIKKLLYESFSMRGRAAHALGDVEIAADDFVQALHLSKVLHLGSAAMCEKLLLVRLCSLQGRDDLALGRLNKVLGKDQTNISAHFFKGSIYHHYAGYPLDLCQNYIDSIYSFEDLYRVAAFNFSASFPEFVDVAKKHVRPGTLPKIKRAVNALAMGDLNSLKSATHDFKYSLENYYSIDSFAYYGLGLAAYKVAMSDQNPKRKVELLEYAKISMKKAVEIYPLEQAFVYAHDGISATLEVLNLGVKDDSKFAGKSVFIVCGDDAKYFNLPDRQVYLLNKN